MFSLIINLYKPHAIESKKPRGTEVVICQWHWCMDAITASLCRSAN